MGKCRAVLKRRSYCLGMLLVLCSIYSVFKGHTLNTSQCSTTWKKHTGTHWVCYVPHMLLLSVDFSFDALWVLTVHQGLIFRLRDEPSSDPIRHGDTISARTFPVMVCSSNDKANDCVLVGCGNICLFAFTTVLLPRLQRCSRMIGQMHEGHLSGTTMHCITRAYNAISQSIY